MRTFTYTKEEFEHNTFLIIIMEQNNHIADFETQNLKKGECLPLVKKKILSIYPNEFIITSQGHLVSGLFLVPIRLLPSSD
jgi:hypothetical protein